MLFKLTQRASQVPSVVKIFLLAASLFSCFITGIGSVTAQTADDHGDTLSDATNLPLGSSIPGRIDPGDDLDVFRLDLSGASGQTHFWIYTTGTLDTLGRLYDSNIELLTFNDDTISGGVIVETNFRFSWTLSPGIYYVAVYSADSTTTGDYTIHATADDHGHYSDAATSLSLGSSATGRIAPGFDRDVFKLDLSGTSGTTDVWIYTTGELDTRGWLYDSSGGSYLVFNNHSYVVGRETSFGIRRNLPRGVYYIVVRSWLTADGDFATGDYTLHAEAVTGPGSAIGTATTLSLDSPTPGMIDTASDADYFRIVHAGSENLVIYAKGLALIDGSSGNFSPFEPLDGTLIDNSGAEISVNVIPEEFRYRFEVYRWGFRIEDDFASGVYYVKVTAPADSTTYPVPYTIHAYEDTAYTNFTNDCKAATAALNNPQISDSLYGCQWHLSNQEQGGEDINVEAVWAEGINGEGINIAVVDDGMYYAHEDLAANINTTLNHNYDTGSHDIYSRYDHHGTAVAGIIAARDNDFGVRGVAPRATIYGYNFLADYCQQCDDISTADTMSRNRVVTAVSNNSWGYRGGPWLSRANQLWESAVDSGIREGYGGKGVFYVFAGGNGGRGHRETPDGTPVGGHYSNAINRGDDSNLGELANYYAVTAVCAVNDGDTRSVYSEKGANLWVCAPSWDFERRGIVTTENVDRYRDDFSGTSAAAPTVSGVAALLRQANPDLTWRDLKLILAASARKNDPANSGWAEGARKYGAVTDTDRYHFNHEYGFGMVDAKAALDLARGWTNVPPMESVSAESEATVEIPPPQADGTPQTVITTLTLNTDIRFTEFVEINTDFEHTSFRDMDIELVSPSGAVSKLTVPFNTRYYTATYRRADGSTFDGPYFVRLDGKFRFGSARHLGENPNGVWTLRLTDHYPELGGTLRSWNIKAYGHVSRPVATLEASPATAVPNQAITVTGQGFTGGSTINAAGDGSEVTLGGSTMHLGQGDRNFNNGQAVTVDSGGSWSATIIVPITAATTTPGTHSLEVTDSGNRSGSADITIPPRTLTIEPAEARPGETATLTGSGFPATNTRDKEQNTPSIEITYAGDLMDTAIPDGDGNITLSFQVPLDAAIPSTNRVEANYMIPGAPSGAAPVTANTNHEVPGARIKLSMDEGKPGDSLTLAGDGFIALATVDWIKIGEIEVTPAPAPATDQNGEFTATVLVPDLADGPYEVQVRVGGVTASANFTVSTGDPLVARYDTNRDGKIQKNEVIKAINDYLFGTGADAPSKADVIRLINLYLFG